MIKIERSLTGWIVYNSRDFKRFHTHTRHYRVAKKIRHCVISNTIPNTECIELLVSCKRLTSNKKYIEKIDKRIAELELNRCSVL